MLKRFEAVSTYDGTDEGMLNEVISPSGERMGPVECADLLNSQAETIEVLREWLRDKDIEMQILVEHARYWASQDESLDTWNKNHKALIVESKLRIAALEGK